MRQRLVRTRTDSGCEAEIGKNPQIQAMRQRLVREGFKFADYFFVEEFLPKLWRSRMAEIPWEKKLRKNHPLLPDPQLLHNSGEGGRIPRQMAG